MKEVILVPIRCWTCGYILTYMDINSEPSSCLTPKVKRGEFTRDEVKVIRCPKCGDGCQFVVTKLQFDKLVKE